MKKFPDKIKTLSIDAIAVALFVLLLCYGMGFDWRALFSLRIIGILLLGAAVLSLPKLLFDFKKEELSALIGSRVRTAGYLATMIFLFFNLKALTEYEALLEVVALSFRPLLYGLVLYEICGKGKKEKGPSPKNPPSVNQTPTETLEVRLRAAGLTIREVQIALLVHTGLSNKEIAEELYIAETTVKKHLSNIFDKLGVEKRSLIK